MSRGGLTTDNDMRTHPLSLSSHTHARTPALINAALCCLALCCWAWAGSPLTLLDPVYDIILFFFHIFYSRRQSIVAPSLPHSLTHRPVRLTLSFTSSSRIWHTRHERSHRTSLGSRSHIKKKMYIYTTRIPWEERCSRGHDKDDRGCHEVCGEEIARCDYFLLLDEHKKQQHQKENIYINKQTRTHPRTQSRYIHAYWDDTLAHFSTPQAL